MVCITINERSKVVRSWRKWREKYCTCHEAATGRRVLWDRKDRLPQAGFSVASTSGLGQGDGQEHTSRGVWQVVAPALGTMRRVTDTWPGPGGKSSLSSLQIQQHHYHHDLRRHHRHQHLIFRGTSPTFPPARNDTCQSPSDFCGRFYFKLFYFLLCHAHFFLIREPA